MELRDHTVILCLVFEGTSILFCGVGLSRRSNAVWEHLGAHTWAFTSHVSPTGLSPAAANAVAAHALLLLVATARPSSATTIREL